MLSIIIAYSRCELEKKRMPFGETRNNHKHPVIVRTKRTKSPGVELALKCPKDKPCQLAGSDSEVSTDCGSITSLLNHDVSCYMMYYTQFMSMNENMVTAKFRNHNIIILIAFSVGIPTYNKGRLKSGRKHITRKVFGLCMHY